ncbi:hypothetical protein ACWCQL_00300 [Streptomyces sp. NPDC002073]
MSRIRVVAVAGAALGLLGGLPAPAFAADAYPYVTAPGARQVRGADSTATAPALETGGSYEDTVAPGERFYRISLDARSSVYAAAVARPGPGTAVAYGDGIDVVLMTAGGRECGSGDRGIFASEQPRPITDVAVRRLREDADCQDAGLYYVKLVRTSGKDSDREPWPVELTVMREPALTTGTAPGPAPSGWPSAVPVLPPEAGTVRAGGTGFNDARALHTGAWRDGLHPGQTRFYRVPVEWGRQLSVSAELAKAPRTTKEHGYAGSGLSVSLYNPARALVASESAPYDGKQAMAALGRTAPVAYDNRFSTDGRVRGTGFAGWYYLAVTVGAKVGEFVADAEALPLTLRVRTEGGPAAAPPYAEDAVAAGFGVSGADRAAADEGLTAVEARESADRRSVMRTVAAGGIGTGAALLLGLGGWALLARRRGPGPG